MNILSNNGVGFAFVMQDGPLPTHKVDFYFGEDFVEFDARQSEELAKRLSSPKVSEFVIKGLKFSTQIRRNEWLLTVSSGQLIDLKFELITFLTQLSAPHALKFLKTIKKVTGEWRE